jgi:hypothetical protein
MNEWTAGRSRPVAGVAMAIAAGLALTACGGPVAPSERLDTRFFESLRSGGHPASHGDGDGAAMLSTAAWTACGGDAWRAVVTGHRDPAPTRHETAAGDSQRLVALALGTYCP